MPINPFRATDHKCKQHGLGKHVMQLGWLPNSHGSISYLLGPAAHNEKKTTSMIMFLNLQEEYLQIEYLCSNWLRILDSIQQPKFHVEIKVATIGLCAFKEPKDKSITKYLGEFTAITLENNARENIR